MEQLVRVLIADDQVRTRHGLQALLEVWPEIEVVGASTNGAEAIRLVEERRPHVVLMDILMTAMDGLEAIRLIKSRWPQVRIVVLTIDATHRTAALAAGAGAFLIKGCPAEAIHDAILKPG
jgi:DNA-binding NarL/FixJ family response regulator